MTKPKSFHTHKQAQAEAREPYYQIVIDYIAQFGQFTEAEYEQIMQNLNIKVYPKGHTLLREGQVSSLCFFVMKGCIRQYYLVDGQEKTTQFYTEGMPVTPYEGTFKGKPSSFYLSCEEETIATIGTAGDEERMLKMFPQMEQVNRLAVEEELGKSRERIASYIINSPEDRYRQLLDTRPDLLDRVPQYQLASYLGITPESLSRIRKRMAGK